MYHVTGFNRYSTSGCYDYQEKVPQKSDVCAFIIKRLKDHRDQHHFI